MFLSRRIDGVEGVSAGPVARRVPRILSPTISRPGPVQCTGTEWEAGLAEACEREGGAFISLHSVPPLELRDARGEVRKHTLCMPFLPFNLKSLMQFVSVIREHRIDVVNWNFSRATNPYVWALSVLCPRVRHWMTEHVSQRMPLPPPPPLHVRWLRRLLLVRYEKVFCVSQFVSDNLRRLGYPNLTTSYMFVNTDRCRPDPQARLAVRQRLGLKDEFVVLFTGQLIRDKGVHVAIDALSRLPPQVVLLVVGEGPAGADLVTQAEAAKLGQRVRFLGHQADVVPFMQAADVAICPSLWAEAAGLVNMEAQSCGLPVVASRVGGIPEIVDDGHTGLLTEPGDAEAVAGALARLLAEPELRAAFARDGRLRMIQQFSADVRIPIYLDQYRLAR